MTAETGRITGVVSPQDAGRREIKMTISELRADLDRADAEGWAAIGAWNALARSTATVGIDERERAVVRLHDANDAIVVAESALWAALDTAAGCCNRPATHAHTNP